MDDKLLLLKQARLIRICFFLFPCILSKDNHFFPEFWSSFNPFGSLVITICFTNFTKQSVTWCPKMQKLDMIK
jgi:hypothetical protein